jgi:L-alanine-DL-glutamate epimerase-like enolase superfamily enzyme
LEQQAMIQSLSNQPIHIDSIEVIPLRVPLSSPVRGSTFTIRNRSTIITRIRSTDGLVGECYNGDSDEKLESIVRILSGEAEPLLRDAKPTSIEGCWQRLLPLTYDLRRPRALGLEAIACIDSALWDLLGKRARLPLAQLWGGFSDSVRLSAICGYDSDGEVEHFAERCLEMGFTGFKFKVGSHSPKIDADRVRRLRKIGGGDAFISVDANQAYSFREAIQFVQLASEHDVAWYEEPCEWTNDRRWLYDLRHMTGSAICAGQSETTSAGVRDLIASGAIDVCNFDASWGAGPSVWQRVAGMASLYGVQMAQHEEPQLAVHLLSSIAHGTNVEFFMPERDPIFWNLVENRGEIVDGRYAVPTLPGWGLVLDEGFIAKYRL